MKTSRCLLVAGATLTSLLFATTAQGQPAPVRIMPLGDSITYGYSSLASPGGYRAPLFQLLTNAGFNVDYIGTVTNNPGPSLPDWDHEGHPGWRIDELDSNFVSWFDQIADPDVILLLIGTNDYGQGYDTANATNRLEALIAKMATVRPFAKIIVANLLKRGEPYDTQIQTTFNPFVPGIVARQAALGRQVYFTNLRAALTLADTFDNLHPTQAGYNKMATNWFAAITNVIGPLGTTNALPPTITVSPTATATRLQYGQINLVATATGSTPRQWQWKFNGVDILGATNASLLLKDLALSQAGVYQAFVTNQFGGTNSTTCTLSVIRNLVRNGHFGTAQDAPNFGSASTNNWILAAPGNWNVPTVNQDSISGMGTCARITGNWNAIVQNTTETIQPNTYYTVTLQARGDNALTVLLMDASDPNPTNWVSLASKYLWIGNTALYTSKTYDFSTNDLSAHVGKKIGIKLRREQTSGTTIMSISQVRLNAFGPPVLSNAQKPGASQASFTINSWPGQTNRVWTSTNLVDWSYLTMVTNVSGADTFIDSTGTAPQKYYQLR